MNIVEAESGDTTRLSRSYKFFADDRETVEDAYAGDIIGIPGKKNFSIGATLTEGDRFAFEPIPRFTPENFARLINKDIGKYKQFNKGLQQLEREGVIQVLYDVDAMRRDPILAVVGVLQFEVMQARLQNEYNVNTRLEHLEYRVARWLVGPKDQIAELPRTQSVLHTKDIHGNRVTLFSSPFYLDLYIERYPDITFNKIA
jgi:peptide chain release factor 3